MQRILRISLPSQEIEGHFKVSLAISGNIIVLRKSDFGKSSNRFRVTRVAKTGKKVDSGDIGKSTVLIYKVFLSSFLCVEISGYTDLLISYFHHLLVLEYRGRFPYS